MRLNLRGDRKAEDRRRGRRLAATLVGVCAVLAVAVAVPALPAAAAASLTVQPITWNIVGLDANNPTL
ncbi:MAG TPA: hypothetical protein VF972_09735, partial [Actinomycetota bacterium]